MGLLKLAVIGGGVYAIAKTAKARRDQSQQQEYPRDRNMSAMAETGPSYQQPVYRDAPPHYSSGENHQSWCNGSCNGRCSGHSRSYTPDESPVDVTGRNQGREDYFQAMDAQRNSFGNEKRMVTT